MDIHNLEWTTKLSASNLQESIMYHDKSLSENDSTEVKQPYAASEKYLIANCDVASWIKIIIVIFRKLNIMFHKWFHNILNTTSEAHHKGVLCSVYEMFIWNECIKLIEKFMEIRFS